MDSKIISVLERGLTVLSALNQADVCEVRHIHQLTGLPKPTIVRLLETLTALGYVVKRKEGGYRLTAKVLGLSRRYRITDTGQLLEAARPAMGWLRSQLAGFPTDLAICDADTMVVVDPGLGLGSELLNRNAGYRLPVADSALGRAYLAFCPEEEREELLRRLSDKPIFAENRSLRALASVLNDARSTGLATRDTENGKPTRVVAAPVRVDDRVIACLSVVASARAMTLSQMERTFGPALAHAAQQIADAYSSGNPITPRVSDR